MKCNLFLSLLGLLMPFSVLSQEVHMPTSEKKELVIRDANLEFESSYNSQKFMFHTQWWKKDSHRLLLFPWDNERGVWNFDKSWEYWDDGSIHMGGNFYTLLNPNVEFSILHDGDRDAIIKVRNPKNDQYNPFQIQTSELTVPMGKVGIGVRNPRYELDVNGTIRSKELIIEAKNWPDYVFSQNYSLMTLEELDKYIKLNQHLPNMPSSENAERNGVEVSEMVKILLRKIEELTLYTIDQNKEIKNLRQEIKILKEETK